MAIQATTVVTFNDGSSDAEYIFNLSLDDTRNLDAEGEVKSSFIPEDIVYLQVNKSSNVDIVDVAVTAGAIKQGSVSTRTNKVTNLFVSREGTDEEEFVLDHIPIDSSIDFIGKNGKLEESTTIIGQFKYVPDKRETPFIAEFEYTYRVIPYIWTAPSMDLEAEETFDMAVVFYINVR